MPLERKDGKMFLTPIKAWQWLIAGIVLIAVAIGLAFVWVYVVLPNLWWVWTVLLGFLELCLLIGAPGYIAVRLFKLGFGLYDDVLIEENCGSLFHKRHILEWVNVQGICPICRTRINVKSLKETGYKD